MTSVQNLRSFALPLIAAVPLLALSGDPVQAPKDYATIPPDPAVVRGALAELPIDLAKATVAASKAVEGPVASGRLDRSGAAPCWVMEAYTDRFLVKLRIDARSGEILGREDVPRFPGDPVRGEGSVTASGLCYYDLRLGDGPSPSSRKQAVRLQFTGWLVDGTQFESTVERGAPVEVGIEKLVKGLEEGVMGMKVGGKRKLVIPHPLGYGIGGKPPIVPARATLIMDVELLALL